MHGRVIRSRLTARLRTGAESGDLAGHIVPLADGDADAAEALAAALGGDGIVLDGGLPDRERGLIERLARQRRIDFQFEPGEVVLAPCREDFVLAMPPPLAAGRWKLSRFTYLHPENGMLAARNPLADCMLRIGDAAARALLVGFADPVEIDKLPPDEMASESQQGLLALFARARLILPCDAEGRTEDDTDPAPRQWDFHELLFHSLARLGRTEKPIGGTFAFKGEIPPAPALKPIPEAWLATVIDLPKPDLAALMTADMPLTAAIEQRRSIRQHSVVPPSRDQLGEFLFRTARVRHRQSDPENGDFAFRPYPGGGACYEMEVYVTVDACVGVPRGFYYYDPLGHRLCLISPPDARMEGLLTDAYWATAGQGRPQILLTLASRFHRLHWKYRSMSYAAQLKNIGVIYQTWYLVATAMNLAGCGLGLGNTDRFCEMTGLDYLEEGSIGEFMLGRPL